MLIHLNEVLSCEEKTVAKNVDLEMNSFDSSLGSFPFLEKEPVALTITNLGEDKLKITGSVRLTAAIPCDRCLEEVSTPLELVISKDLLRLLSAEKWI